MGTVPHPADGPRHDAGPGSRPPAAGYHAAPMTAAEVAWTLYREGPGRYDEATELARGIAADPEAAPDEVARAGTLLFAAGSYDDADAARARALAAGADPQLLAYLDTACTLRTGDGRAARTALSQHLAAAPDPLHPDMPWLAATTGAPLLAWQAARRAGLSTPRAASYAARGAWNRSPQRACRAVCAR